MKGPFFSVIIPTLNEEKFLPTILKSLTKQTFRGFEVILVDAKSVDKTKKVFDTFRSSLPKSLFYESDRRNVAFQRNLGAKHAKGKYLVFFDADVNIGKTFLEELHIASVKYNFPLATTWILPDSEKPIDNVMVLFANLGLEVAKSINRPFVGGYNTIVKKALFRRIGGFAENLLISEDHDFALRATQQEIDLYIFKEPRVVVSLRRFRSEGTLKVLRKYAQAQIYSYLKGPITTKLFDYPMGGHVHRRRRRRTKTKLVRLEKYLTRLENIQKQIIILLSD